MHYKIGTRGSKLALAQAEYIQGKLQEKWREHTFSIQIIQTKGDSIQDRPLHEIEGKGLFVREIEQELLDGNIHIAVHSMKDMPVIPAPGLAFTRCIKREDARDVLILREVSSLDELPPGAVIGTGSIRRKAQLLRLRPDLQIVGIRGNVDTRLRKMEEEKLDGIVLAAAGLHRLGMKEKITQYLSYDQMIPSPAQGVLALEIREEEEAVRLLLDAFWDEESDKTATVERRFLQLSGGGCHTPAAAVCEKTQEGYRLRAMTGDRDGTCLVFADVYAKEPDGLAEQALSQMKKDKMTGTVYLVGAGPGDSQLLTRRGYSLLKRADCVVYDRLIPPELLELTPVECERIYVGKKNHHHSMEQEKIQKLLIDKAHEYPCVVRLKGGDPYVFGRGGEEALALAEHGIVCEVVPGVTSAIAGPAYAGIPVTHRGIAGGFRVVTAHDRRDSLADIDFSSMAKGTETYIFLMGLSKLDEIVSHLLQAGMPEDKKAAVISKAATREQKVCFGTLATIVSRVNEQEIVSPALIVIGDVVGLAANLPHMNAENSPVSKVLVPKIGEKESPLVDLLWKAGVRADEVQVGEIKYLEDRISKEEIDEAWLVFTSKHGVHGFMKQLFSSGMDTRVLAHSKIAAVGEKTAAILKQYGLVADFTASQSDRQTLFSELNDRLTDTSLVLYMSGPGTVPENIYRGTWIEKNVYENHELPMQTIEHPEDYETAMFTCASSAERLTRRLSHGIPQKWQENGVYSIGTACTEKLRKLGYEKVVQPQTPGVQELCELYIRQKGGNRK